MTVLASLFFLAVASAPEVPLRPAASYTEAEIYTEPHNAAAAAIGTQNFIVGRMAKECYATIGKPEAFVQEFTQSWQKRNEPYLRAATIYAANVLSYYERTQGQDKAQAAYQEYVQSVRGQGAAAVADRFAAHNRTEACTSFISQVDAGSFDVKPGYPFFQELSELVQILNSFGS